MLLQTLMYAMQQMDNDKQLRQYHVPPVSILALQYCFKSLSQPDMPASRHMHHVTSNSNPLLEAMKFSV